MKKPARTRKASFESSLMQASGRVLGNKPRETRELGEIAAPLLEVSTEVNPGGIVKISLKGRAGERFLILAAPHSGPMQLGNFPIPVDLGNREEDLILALDGTLDSSGKTLRKLEIPDDPLLPGRPLYWQALLFSAQGVAKTNLAQTFVWERA
jgi:hypothetical protein